MMLTAAEIIKAAKTTKFNPYYLPKEIDFVAPSADNRFDWKTRSGHGYRTFDEAVAGRHVVYVTVQRTGVWAIVPTDDPGRTLTGPCLINVSQDSWHFSPCGKPTLPGDTHCSFHRKKRDRREERWNEVSAKMAKERDDHQRAKAVAGETGDLFRDAAMVLGIDDPKPVKAAGTPDYVTVDSEVLRTMLRFILRAT